jgi:hypothetical protein
LFFDALLAPFERLGDGFALVIISGLFGVLALLVFKRISFQSGIKAAKDRIKGHMIAIRLYQDDLQIVASSFGKVLLHNVKYLGLNLMPVVPLFAPFTLIAAQLVVRYAFSPLPVKTEAEIQGMLPGEGVMLEVRMKADHRIDVEQLSLEFPQHIQVLTPLARNAADGLALVEFVATAPGVGEITLKVGGEVVGTKSVVAGVADRLMQPERVSDFLSSWLWPAEPTFSSSSPLYRVSFQYPDRRIGFLPSGAGGVLLTFFVASIAFGLAVLKPLNIQI